MEQAIRGVNLGGWLVLERWMTPSVFAGMAVSDEYGYCLRASKKELSRLREHRDSFVMEEDFRWLKAAGIGAVRIPVGYWLFGDVEPYIGSVEYLDKAFAWAEKHDIKVLVSLHGAPGSQNGEMHSGRQGAVAWHTDQANIDATLDCIRRLARRYRASPQLSGISLLNEPGKSIPKRVLKRFYRKAYRIVRQECGAGVQVVFSDGFQPRRWNFVLHRLLYRNVAIDTHQYRVFTPADKRTPAAGHIRGVVSATPLLLKRMRRHHAVIVGEWSAALDGQSLAGLDAGQRQAAHRAYCQAQLQAFDRMAAWYYWSYKTEEGGVWSFRDCYGKGWFGRQ